MRRSRLRLEVLEACVDGGVADLTRAELAVRLTLFRDTKPDGTARASLDDLARRGGFGSQAASRGGSLERRRMLQVLGRGGSERGPSAYRVFPYSMEYPDKPRSRWPKENGCAVAFSRKGREGVPILWGDFFSPR